MRLQEIKKIMKENEKYAKMLEEYDKTGHLPTEKIRRNFTLKRMSVKKLKEISKKRRKNMSEIIDEMIAKELG